MSSLTGTICVLSLDLNDFLRISTIPTGNDECVLNNYKHKDQLLRNKQIGPAALHLVVYSPQAIYYPPILPPTNSIHNHKSNQQKKNRNHLERKNTVLNFTFKHWVNIV